jgi:hypothetical protein
MIMPFLKYMAVRDESLDRECLDLDLETERLGRVGGLRCFTA